MSVEFRQRKPTEYAKIAWKRRWLIALPTVAVTTAVAWVVWFGFPFLGSRFDRLPDVFESVTLIVVKPSTLPNTVVPSMTEDNLSRQLSSIAQVVTSRSSLEPLVDKYELYKAERLRGEPIENVINLMRKDINVEVNTSRNDITNGFNITYRGRDPRTAQAVTAELAGKYIGQQTENSINAATQAKQFIDDAVNQAKRELDEIDQHRLVFMQQNLGNLPSGATSLVAQLNGLREQQKVLLTETGRLQDRRSSLATQVTLLEKQTQQDIEDLATKITDPKTTLGWSQLITKKAQLQGEMTRLTQEYTEKHPDVIAKKKEVDQVQTEMDQMVAEWKEKIKTESDRLKNRPDLGVASAQAQIKQIDGEIKRQQKLLSDNEGQINLIVGRINSVPGAEVALGAIEREYQTKKASYDSLLAQQMRIGLSADATSQQKGDGIQVVDPANLPSQPVAPKRLLLSGIGLVFGLGTGLLLAALIEVPRLFTIQTREDVRHYTGLPVLVSVPRLLSPKEATSIPRRRKLLLAAGMAGTAVSIPILALALKLTHVFEFLSTAGRA